MKISLKTSFWRACSWKIDLWEIATLHVCCFASFAHRAFPTKMWQGSTPWWWVFYNSSLIGGQFEWDWEEMTSTMIITTSDQIHLYWIFSVQISVKVKPECLLKISLLLLWFLLLWSLYTIYVQYCSLQ